VLECDEGEAETHLAALDALVQSVEGSVCVTEVTTTCLALAIDAPPAALPRLKAALKLGGATLVRGSPATSGQLAVILAIQPIPQP
jgi:hypothetical protein